MKVTCLFFWICIVTLTGFRSAHAQMERIQAAPSAGFHHDYLLLLPSKLEPNSPFVVVSPTPHTSDHPAEFTAAAERIARNVLPLLEQLGLPVLVPILPRPPVKVAEDHYINLHLPGLSRAALLEKDPKLARIDQQVLAMVEDGRRRVKEARGVQTHARSIFSGFSAAGHFATRMAALHPEKVLAVWAGGTSGHPIVPLAEVQARTLTYPVGVADLEEIAGKPFNRPAFSRIPIMLVQGASDTNTSLPSEPKPSESYTFEQAELVREILGRAPLERLDRVKTLYEAAGASVETKVYPDVGHQITPEIARDMLQFITGHAAAARQ